MGAILFLLGRVVSVAHAALSVFSFFKKAGADEKENEILKERIKTDEKNLEELAASNAFRNRLERDPAYAERMRKLLGGKDDKDAGEKK